MNIILAIESSAVNCSVVLRVGDAYYQRSATGKRSHTEFLLAFIDEVLNEAGVNASLIDAVAFSAGPGAFTGIRLACSVAKSFAYVLSIPVMAISTLEVAAFDYLQSQPTKTVTVVSDARMDDVYIGSYGFTDGITKVLMDDAMIKRSELSLEMMNTDVLISDCQGLLQHTLDISSLLYCDVALDAKAVADIAAYKLASGEDLQDAFSVEAIYLRDKRSWKNIEQQKSHRAEQQAQKNHEQGG